MAADGLDVMENKNEEGKNKEAAKVDPELLIKHPLQNTWTLWFFKMESNRSWEESQMEIASFTSVEDFWALYNHIEVASRLKVGCDYSMFKHGIKPMWEDGSNCKGGRWLINLNKQQRATELDNFWLEVLLLMIGESFDKHSDDVNGAVVNVRGKGDKLGIWTSNATNSESIMKIGKRAKSVLNLPNQLMSYQAHSQSQSKSGSRQSSSHTL